MTPPQRCISPLLTILSLLVFPATVHPQTNARRLALTPLAAVPRTPLVSRTIDLDLRDLSVADALDAIARAGVPVMYGEATARAARRVTLRARGLSAGDALSAVLAGTGLGAFLTDGGRQILILEAGTITGRVTDSISGMGVSGARVVATAEEPRGAGVARDRFTTTSASDGRFRIDGVPDGDYLLEVSHSQFARAERRVHVSAGETTADVALVRPAADLPAVAITERTPSYADATVATGLKLSASVLEVPQSVQTVSRELIEDRQLATVRETARMVSGLAPGRSATNELVIRGINDNGATTAFGLAGNTFAVNGLKNYLAGYETDVPLVNVERVEVLKGASGVLYGFNQPGGMVNLVTKQPLATPRYVVSTSTGSWRRMRLDADLTGPLSGDGRLLYRVNAGISSTPDYRDVFFNRNVVFAPTLTYRASDRTQLGVELLYTRTQRTAWYDWGVPARDTKGDDVFGRVDRQYSSSQIGDAAVLSAAGAIVKLDHRLADGVAVRSATSLSGNQVDVHGHVPDFGAASPDSAGNVGLKYRQVSRDYSGFFSTNYIAVERRAGAIGHRIVAGVDAMSGSGEGREMSASNTSATGQQVAPINIYHPSYGVRPTGNYVYNGGYTIGGAVGFVGAYVQDQVSAGSSVDLLVGIRADRYESRADVGAPTGTNHPILPNAGIMYKATPALSLYASYLSGFEPQVVTDPAAGGPFDPLTSSQIEAGVKRVWGGGALTTTASLYRIVRHHELISANDNTNPDRLRQLGRTQSDGVEADVNGEVIPGLSVSGNYAYNFARPTSSDDPTIVGQRLPNAPAHIGGMWARYDVRSGWLQGVGVGAGASMVSERIGAFERSRYPGYTLLDAAVYYRFDNVSIAVNGNNLSNASYLSGVWSDFYAQRGLPRNMLVKLGFVY